MGLVFSPKACHEWDLKIMFSAVFLQICFYSVVFKTFLEDIHTSNQKIVSNIDYKTETLTTELVRPRDKRMLILISEKQKQMSINLFELISYL